MTVPLHRTSQIAIMRRRIIAQINLQKEEKSILEAM
jgi:hypothetical protein